MTKISPGGIRIRLRTGVPGSNYLLGTYLPRTSFSAFLFPTFHRLSSVQVRKWCHTLKNITILNIFSTGLIKNQRIKSTVKWTTEASSMSRMWQSRRWVEKYTLGTGKNVVRWQALFNKCKNTLAEFTPPDIRVLISAMQRMKKLLEIKAWRHWSYKSLPLTGREWGGDTLCPQSSATGSSDAQWIPPHSGLSHTDTGVTCYKSLFQVPRIRLVLYQYPFSLASGYIKNYITTNWKIHFWAGSIKWCSALPDLYRI